MVVDLVADELVVVDGTDAAVEAWLAERSPDMITLALERDETFPTIVVRTAISPHGGIPTLLNTGGRGTEFSSEAVPGLADAAMERLGSGVSGADVMGAQSGESTLVVAGHEVRVPSLAVRSSMHDPQGLVGMDVLRGTILTVCADVSRPVMWQVPATGRSVHHLL